MPKNKTSQPKLDDLKVNSLQARSIQLVDASGKVKASLFTTPGTKSSPSMTVMQMFGDDGVPQLELQMDGNSPSIRLTAASGQVGFSVAVNETSHGLMIGDLKGRPVVQIGIYHEGNGKAPWGTKPAVVLADFNDDTQSLEVAINEMKILQPRKKRKG